MHDLLKAVFRCIWIPVLGGGFASGVNGQSPEWTYFLEGDSSDQSLTYFQHMAQLPDGDLIVAGSISDVVDFGLDTSTFVVDLDSGVYDFYVARYDTSGALVWADVFSGSEQGSLESMTTDLAGNVYIGGWFRGIYDFDPGPGVVNLDATDSTLSEGFMVKINANGSLAWARQIKSTGFALVLDLAVDDNQQLYAIMRGSEEVDLDPGPGAYVLTDTGRIFLARYDTNGDFVWGNQMGGMQLYGNKVGVVALSPTQEIYIMTDYHASGQYGPFDFSNSGQGLSMVLLKLDTNGNYIWGEAFGSSSTGGMEATDVEFNSQGNPIIIGSYFGTIDFDPGLGTQWQTSSGWYDGFVLQLSANGDFSWVKFIEGYDRETPIDIELDSLDNIYLTGSFYGWADFNPDPVEVVELSPYGFFNVAGYVLKLDPTGNFEWVIHYTGPGLAYGVGLVYTPTGHLYVAGSFGGEIDFDPGPGVNNYDSYSTRSVNAGFLAKFNESTVITERVEVVEEELLVSVFPNPTAGPVQVDLGKVYPVMEAVWYDLQGRELGRTQVKGQRYLDLELDAPGGVYLLHLLGGEGESAVVRVVRQ